MISEARLRANRQNAQKSTGPTTEEGKLRSRCNALKHGLTGWGVVLPDDEAEAVEHRVASWAGSLLPKGDADAWLSRQAALASLRIDRCQQLERDRRGVEAARALACWDEDRMAEAEDLASRLSRDPSRIAAKLRCSRQGCSWLLVRWRKLDALIDEPGGWQDEHRSLALDLLGEPIGTRGPELALLASASPEALHAITRGEIDDLEALMAQALDELDDTERLLAEAGRPVADSGEQRRLRRYEAACWRRLWWSLGQLRSASARPSPDPDFDPDLDLDLGPISDPSPAALPPLGPPRPIPAPAITAPAAPRAEDRPLADRHDGPAHRLAPDPRPDRAADPAPAVVPPRLDHPSRSAEAPEPPPQGSPRPFRLAPLTSPFLARLGISIDPNTDLDLDLDLDADTDADTDAEPAGVSGSIAPRADSSAGTPGPLGHARRPPAPDRRAIRKARRALKKRSKR